MFHRVRILVQKRWSLISLIFIIIIVCCCFEKRLELHSAAPRATLTPLSCSPNFPRTQYLDTHALMHELIVKQRHAKFASVQF